MNAVNKLILCCCLIYVRNNINSTASEIVEKHKNVPQLYAEHLNDYIDYFNCKFEERIFDDSNNIDALIHSAYKRALDSYHKTDTGAFYDDDFLNKLYHHDEECYENDTKLYSKILDIEDKLKKGFKLSSSQMLELIENFKEFFTQHCDKKVKGAINTYENRYKHARKEEYVDKLEAKLKKSSYVHLINRSNANKQAENIENNIEQNMNAPS